MSSGRPRKDDEPAPDTPPATHLLKSAWDGVGLMQTAVFIVVALIMGVTYLITGKLPDGDDDETPSCVDDLVDGAFLFTQYGAKSDDAALFEQGLEEKDAERWQRARAMFVQRSENFPDSPFAAHAAGRA